jgi:chromosome partitioning protein
VSVLCLLNQKGGVGKTSTCHHLSGTLAATGRRVLLLDLDPQASLTQGFWGPQAARALAPSATVAAILAGDEPFPDQVIRPSGVDGIDLVPGSRRANSFNLPDPHLTEMESQLRLRDFLDDEIRGRYDLVLLDCPPNLCLCSWAALSASDHLAVPLQAEDYGAQGIIDIQESMALVQQRTNPALRLLGFLITMYEARKTLHQMYDRRLRSMYGEAVFATRVPRAAEFPEAIAHRKTVAQYKPKGAAAKAMKTLADEILARIAGTPAATPIDAKEVA